MKRLTGLLTFAIVALMPCVSLAGTASATFRITVSVLASCSVRTSDLTLKPYTTGGAATGTASPGSIDVRCSKGTPAQVFVDGRTLTGPDGSMLTVALSQGGREWAEGQGVAVMGEGHTLVKVPVGATVVAGQRVALGDYVGDEMVRVVY